MERIMSLSKKYHLIYPLNVYALRLCTTGDHKKMNSYVFVIIDHFSKFMVLVPLYSADAKTIAKALRREEMTKFGCLEIFSDSGKCLKAS